jgi:hypothetical protein
MTDYKALAAQINEAHGEIVKSFSGSLEHAIKAGEWLTTVQDNLKAERSNIAWSGWLEENCPGISQRTANLYKQVAKHKQRFKNVGNTVANLNRDRDLSLRDAVKLIPKNPNKARATKAPAARRPTVENVLSDLAPDELFTALAATWDVEQIADLMVRLGDYLRERGVPPPQLSTAALARR